MKKFVIALFAFACLLAFSPKAEAAFVNVRVGGGFNRGFHNGFNAGFRYNNFGFNRGFYNYGFGFNRFNYGYGGVGFSYGYAPATFVYPAATYYYPAAPALIPADGVQAVPLYYYVQPTYAVPQMIYPRFGY